MRLATLLVKRKLKPADLLFKLDEDHNGMVDEEEFVRELRAMALSATKEELSEIFRQLDHVYMLAPN